MDTAEKLGPVLVQVNVELPADLHRRLKIAAATVGWTIKDSVTVAIEEWLDNHAAA
jgi:hypothetical protein